jgi:hypothetical protein
LSVVMAVYAFHLLVLSKGSWSLPAQLIPNDKGVALLLLCGEGGEMLAERDGRRRARALPPPVRAHTLKLALTAHDFRRCISKYRT